MKIALQWFTFPLTFVRSNKPIAMKNPLRVLVLACVVFSLAACRVYRPVDQPADVVFADDIPDYIGSYDIYYRNSSSVYNLRNARVSGDTIYGMAVKVNSAPAQKKNELSLFVNDTVAVADSMQVAVHKSEIKNVQVMGRDGRASFLKSTSAIALLLGIVIACVLLIGLIGVSVWASAASTDSSATSSNQSSDSGNSGSGNSGSGSDSGSGTSNSGCYIATMVYGSYDAPEVWVLRRFRDNVLQHSRGGRWFIGWYYSWSPGFVAKYSRYRFVHRAAKLALQPFIWLLK